MDIGICLPQSGDTAPSAVASFAIAAERAGFGSLWAADRILAPLAPRMPYPASADGELPSWMSNVADPLIELAAAATVTSTIRLGTSVLVAPWYPPLLLARSSTTLDRLSAGRFTLGLGVGWSVDEFDALGTPFTNRGARMEEILDVLDAVWNDDAVSITTTREHIAPSTVGLKPTRGRIPVSMAAFTPAGLDRIARRADGWNVAGIPVEIAATMWRDVLAAAERAGRNPAEMRLIIRAIVHLVGELPEGRPDFTGSLQQVRDDINRCMASGADEVFLDLHNCTTDADQMLALASEIAERALTSA
ncbi:MAG: TIGR03619 family F420-dependent LLM class oxidoreductase [Acidimicrobiales bacterium]